MVLVGHCTFAVAVCVCSHSADSRAVALRDTAKAQCPSSLILEKKMFIQKRNTCTLSLGLGIYKNNAGRCSRIVPFVRHHLLETMLATILRAISGTAVIPFHATKTLRGGLLRLL